MNNVLAAPKTIAGGYETRLYTPKKQTSGKIIPCDKISAKDEAGIVRLYKALVPEDISKDIDIRLIVEEGFPAFEQTIGEAEFSKVKKFFGIGDERKTKPRQAEIISLLGKLRTIENATKYISGYKNLVEDVASRLCETPEGMGVFEKAKLVRAYMVIFGDYHFFPEDFSIIQVGNKEPERVLRTERVFENNKRPFYPEELFFMYELKIGYFSKESIMYGIIADELLGIEKRLRKEVMEIAELKVNPDNTFSSENKAAQAPTFGSVRKLKMKVSPVKGVYPIEIFCNKDLVKQWNFVELYKLYKTLDTTDWDTFPKVEKTEREIVGSRSADVTRQYYQVDEDMFSGYTEMSRVQRYFQHLAEMEYIVEAQYLVNNEKIQAIPVNSGKFMAAIQFANYMEYISKDTSYTRDFEIADALLEKDTEGTWLELKRGEITIDEVKEKLHIDRHFEKEVLHINKHENPEEVAVRFALENGYCEAAPDSELVKNVIIPGNESALQKFAADEINIHTLKKKLGFDEKFAEMYFDLKKVDISVIEEKLQEMKRSMSGKAEIKANALLINLYCYLVEEQIPCGVKMKAPKRNKGLKPANLRSLLG